ncbi:MAG: chemotaxis protein CheX [bacterium]|nr:chemotaxis protein CheX [bacterium]
MSQTELHHASIVELAKAVLEQTAFVFVEDVEASDEDDLTIHGHIRFEAERLQGDLSLSANEEFARELAAGIQASEEDEVTAEDGQLALLELANILAGQVIVELGGVDEDFTLGLPQVPATSPRTTGTAVRLQSCDGALLIRVRTEPRARDEASR